MKTWGVLMIIGQNDVRRSDAKILFIIWFLLYAHKIRKLSDHCLHLQLSEILAAISQLDLVYALSLYPSKRMIDESELMHASSRPSGVYLVRRGWSWRIIVCSPRWIGPRCRNTSGVSTVVAVLPVQYPTRPANGVL